MTTSTEIDNLPLNLKKLRTTDRPLTARAVADLCGVELKTVHNWAVEGRLEHFRTPGRHLRFAPSAVLLFLENCGYELPVEGASRVALLVTSSRAHHWQASLSDYRVERVAELYRALIVAGRARPDLIVFDTKEVTTTALRAFARACQNELPHTSLILVAARLPTRLALNATSSRERKHLARVRWATPSTLAQMVSKR